MTFAETVVDRGGGVLIGAAALTIELPGAARVLIHLPVQLIEGGGVVGFLRTNRVSKVSSGKCKRQGGRLYAEGS